jgi:predicted MFS family arabinose efflux permease
MSGPGKEGSRLRVMSRPLSLLFVSAFGSSTGFYLLVSVVPLYAASIGGGSVGAGLATGALMLSTVAADLVTPRLVSAFGYRATLAASLLLLGVPVFALGAASSMAWILAVCVARGAGFGITVVVGSALVAELLAPERRGEGLGLYRVFVGAPAVAALPLGVWLVGRLGYPPAFVAGAMAALAGLAVVASLPGRAPGTARAPEKPVGVLAGLGTPALLRPLMVFASTTMAAGVVATFVPLASPGASGNLGAVALFVQATTATLSRLWAGRGGDRHGQVVLLVPAVVASSVGILALVVNTSQIAVVIGMAGFGVAQNATLSVMFERVAKSGYGERPVEPGLRRGLGAGRRGIRRDRRADRLPGGLRAHLRASSRGACARLARA